RWLHLSRPPREWIVGCGRNGLRRSGNAVFQALVPAERNSSVPVALALASPRTFHSTPMQVIVGTTFNSSGVRAGSSTGGGCGAPAGALDALQVPVPDTTKTRNTTTPSVRCHVPRIV